MAQSNWASVEGQSDYFANLKCMRHMFLEDDNEAILKTQNIPTTARTLCEEKFSNRIDQLVCMRSALASLKAGELFSSLSQSSPPTLDRKDPNVVNTTYESHPGAQCRVDTYFAAALCPVDEEVEIGQRDPSLGVCNRSQNQEFGARPLCWYKDTATPTPGPNPTPTPPGGNRPIGPSVGGQVVIQSSRPDQIISINIDVRNVSGATGFLIEASKPNTIFSNPNGNQPDPSTGLGYQAFRGTFGTYGLLPARQLPGWGSYQFRILALDQNGRALGIFSEVLTIILRP
jgi:hypothetical protein